MTDVSREQSGNGFGKGLDIGTANLVCASRDDDGAVGINQQRNAFIEVKPDAFTQNMLQRQSVPFVAYKNSLYVLGAAAYEFANIMAKEVRRPMRDGMISASEVEALPVVKLLIETLVGKPRSKDELICFSIPAEPVDADLNVIYHRAVLESILRGLGYKPLAIYEGLAVIYSELSDREYTGIGASFGGGMVNICVAYRSVPALAFSVGRSGDWIDINAAAVLGAKTPRVTLLKERGINLAAPRTREEQAIAIYYRHLLHYVVEHIHRHLTTTEGLPEFLEPVDLVCAGGTTMVGGFLDILREELEAAKLPIPLREVRSARDPLNTTARGCLVASVTE